MGRNYIPMEDCDEESIMEICYDPELNYFIDSSFGNIIYNIYELLEPWKIRLFKEEKTDRMFWSRGNSFFINLYYLDDEEMREGEEMDYVDFMGDNY